MAQLVMDFFSSKTDTEFLNPSKFSNPKSYSSVKSKKSSQYPMAISNIIWNKHILLSLINHRNISGELQIKNNLKIIAVTELHFVVVVQCN